MPSAARRAVQVSNASRLDAVEAALDRIASPDIKAALADLGVEPRPSIVAAARQRAAEEAERAADTARLAAAAADTVAAESRRNAEARARSDAIYRKTVAGVQHANVQRPPMSPAEIDRRARSAFPGNDPASLRQRQLLVARMSRNDERVGLGGRPVLW